jgi:uncharacterized protein (TIGR00369 family)
MNAVPTQAAAPTASLQHTLDDWQAREAEVRGRLAAPGLSRPDQLMGRTGLEVFHAMLQGELPFAPISDTLDFVMVEASHGRAVFQGRPQFRHYNPLGTVHGGWISTLLDSAVACAVHTTLPVGRTYTTLELKVNFVKAVSERVPLVRAIGEVIHVGGRIGTAHGRLVGPDGTLYAHATTTCLVLDLPSPTATQTPPR